MKPIEQDPKTPHIATGIFVLLGAARGVHGVRASKIAGRIGRRSPSPVVAALGTIVAALFASAGLIAALPASASAYAVLEGPPTYSSAPGLPDGRVYEQVSPADKNGNEAGAGTSIAGEDVTARAHYGLAAADGNAVLFEGTGPMGETAAPYNLYFVASKNRSSVGWSTHAVMPRAPEPTSTIGAYPKYLDPSADLSRVMVLSPNAIFTQPHARCGPALGSPEGAEQLYLSGTDPFMPATWLDSAQIAVPIENCGTYGEAGAPVGGTPNFSTVYFTYSGTLLPEDASRAPHAHPHNTEDDGIEAWGFYEDHEGLLREAGVLPDGHSLDPFGAVPAASGHGRATAGNQVSTQTAPDGAPAGSRAFFVSPDPASCEDNGTHFPGQNDCTLDPPELYVRESGERTAVVSRDTLLPDAGGLPASAPGGVLRMPNPTVSAGEGPNGSYVFASPDGSQAFFQSESALTKAAEQASPGTKADTYDFDVETGVVTYLPDVAGEIVATDTDGSSLAFVRPAAAGGAAELDLWSAGPLGGTVTPITQLPDGYAETARMSTDGSVVVFRAAGLPDFNDVNTAEIFRYAASANTLGCVSCAPAGVTPTGGAVMSQLRTGELREGYSQPGMVEPAGTSSNGERVFFDTPDPLVPQDTNTATAPGYRSEIEPTGRDVYEWENGVVYLISSGKNSRNSYYLDNSENGDDVFFATTEDLVPGDTDGAYDVYDARVPRPGDSSAPAAVPCEGSVCQGPPSVPSPLTPPASATFSGLGSPAPEVTPPPPRKKTTRKTVKCKRGDTRKNKKCTKQKAKKSSKKKGRS